MPYERSMPARPSTFDVERSMFDVESSDLLRFGFRASIFSRSGPWERLLVQHPEVARTAKTTVRHTQQRRHLGAARGPAPLDAGISRDLLRSELRIPQSRGFPPLAGSAWRHGTGGASFDPSRSERDLHRGVVMDTIGSHILHSRSPRRSPAPAPGAGRSCDESGAAGADTTHYSASEIGRDVVSW